MTRRLFHISLVTIAGFAVSNAAARTAGPTVSLDRSTTHQVFDGWESVIQSTLLGYIRQPQAYQAMLDDAVGDLGITRIQIPVFAGTERPSGYGQAYIDGEISERELVEKYAYDVVNDNSNPKVADLSRFDFALLDARVEHVVLPLKERIAQRGEKLYAYLSYVDFGKSRFEHYDRPEEYAELMAVLFDHLKAKYGFVPDGINVINEPDQTPWTGEMIGRAIAATASRLHAAGYHPDFIAPSTVDRSRAVPFFEEAIRVRGARQQITAIGYHCYADRDRAKGIDSFKAIGDAGVRYEVKTAMTECWGTGNTYEQLHRDLKSARVSAWQQGGLNGPHGYYTIDPVSKRANLNPKTRIMRQYYKYIRPGAIRIEATSNDPAFDPVAFINSDGTYVVVVKVDAPGTFTIENLPAGSYATSHSSAAQAGVEAPALTITAGQPLTTQMPARGVMTVQGTTRPSGQ